MHPLHSGVAPGWPGALVGVAGGTGPAVPEGAAPSDGGLGVAGLLRRGHGGCADTDLRFEVLILRVPDAFQPRGATWSGQVISSPPGPSGGPSKTHLLPGGRVPQVHRARSPVPPRLPRFATPRSVHQFAAVAAGAYPPRCPPNAWSPGAPAPPGSCYWLVASGTPLGSRGGCLA